MRDEQQTMFDVLFAVILIVGWLLFCGMSVYVGGLVM
jgi:hypothetical protein